MPVALKPSAITPEEEGLAKRCKKCKTLRGMGWFWPYGKRITADGRLTRDQVCIPCRRAEPKATQSGEAKRARNRARSRAYVRLTHMVPEMYAQVLKDELAKEGL